jgi:hypothetical protein
MDLDDVARIFRTNMTRLVIEAAARRRALGQQRSGGRPVGLLAALTLAVTALLAALGTPAVAQEDPRPPAPRPFATVLERVVRGDLVMVGNSNLLSAGGWRSGAVSVADIDDESSEMCIIRGLGFPRACADNSSSARLDLPRGARVIEARLYVQSTVAPDVGPLKVRLDGPREGFDYRVLGGATLGVPKLYEAGGGRHGGTPLRQAVWDVTKYVARRGAGSYTVADIVSERAAPYLPYASWAIVAAYDLDPASGRDLADIRPADRPRFAQRAVSWHDGFSYLTGRSIDVPVAGFEIPTAGAVFAKSFHFVGHGQLGESDNLLFNGNPLGNNLTPGDAPPPRGVDIEANPSCNSTTDVQNDTICVLGAPVANKRPGRRAYLASGDGSTRSSGSGVDLDVIRIPDRYLVAGSTAGTLSVQVTGSDTLAPGMLAVSVDVARPAGPAVVQP